MVVPIMRSLSGRHFAAEFVEEIEDEADLVHRSILFRARGLQHGEALSVGVQVEVIEAQPAIGELAGRPELGFVSGKGVSGSGVAGHHELALARTIKKLLAVARPLGILAATSGNLPLAARAWERPDV